MVAKLDFGPRGLSPLVPAEGFKLEAGSVTATNMFSVQRNGVSAFAVDTGSRTVLGGSLAFNASTSIVQFANNTCIALNGLSGTIFRTSIGISTGNPTVTNTSAFLAADAADILAQRNGTNPQTFNIYNTYTDSSNYERLVLQTDATAAYIYTQKLGTGSARPLYFGTNGSARFQIDPNGHILFVNDNNYDFGASGANRPRNVYVGNTVVIPDGNTKGLVFTGGSIIYGVGSAITMYNGATNMMSMYASGVKLANSALLAWTNQSDSNSATNDLVLVKDALNTLGIRNSTTAQAFNLYNTYTDASNYERFETRWVGNVCYLTTSALGTGTVRRLSLNPGVGAILGLGANGTTEIWQINTSGHFMTGTDNTYDIGGSASGRPRNVYVANSGTFGNDLTIKATGVSPSLYIWNATPAVRVALGFNGTAIPGLYLGQNGLASWSSSNDPTAASGDTTLGRVDVGVLQLSSTTGSALISPAIINIHLVGQ